MYSAREDGIMLVDERSISIKGNYLQNQENPAWGKRVHNYSARMSCLKESTLHFQRPEPPGTCGHDYEVTRGNHCIKETLREVRRLEQNTDSLWISRRCTTDTGFGGRF